MKTRTVLQCTCKLVAPLAFGFCMTATPAYANMGSNVVTLIEMGDLHGTLVPHAAELSNSDGDLYYASEAGGLAKLKKVVDDIRAENPDNLLLSCGDLTHGSAEALFTVGDAMIKAMNAFGIDVFTPGNWDFGYGPAVFRNRFTSFGPKPNIPPWTAVMAGYVDCVDNDVGGTCSESKGIIKADFPAVAINLYNTPPLPESIQGTRVLDAYRIFERGGIRIAVIGITASIVPQQADVFNIGLRFTQGVEELPEILAEVKDKGADLIVVQSERFRPVMVGLQYFFQLNIAWGLIMAYLTTITLPIIIFYLAMQKAFIESIASTGIKG